MDIENELVDMAVAEKERVRPIESSVDINTLLCVNYMASGKLLSSTGSSTWWSVMI